MVLEKIKELWRRYKEWKGYRQRPQCAMCQRRFTYLVFGKAQNEDANQLFRTMNKHVMINVCFSCLKYLEDKQSQEAEEIEERGW